MIKKLLQHKTFWVMVITCAGMGVSLLVRVLLIPRRFGFSDTADALTTALTVTLVADTIVRESAKFSLVPLFVTREKELTHTEYQRFTNSVLLALVGIGFGIFLCLELFAPWIAGGLLRKSTHDVEKVTSLLRLCAPILIFGCGSTVLGAFLNSRQRFKTVALRNALPSGSAAVIFLLLWNTEALENWIAVGYAAGFAAYFGWLCIGTYQTGHRYTLCRRDFQIPIDTLRTLKNTITFPTLGFTLRQITNRLLVEIYFVSQFGEGAITRYKCAFQLFSALQTLIGISIATTGLPDMATDDAAQDKKKLGRTLQRNARTAISIGIPVTLSLLIFHGEISGLLYGSGTTDDTAIECIGHLLFWLSTGLIFSCLIPVLNAGLYAQKAYTDIFANMVMMACLNLIAAYGLIEMRGLTGVALAVSITALIAVGNLTRLLRKTETSWL